MLRLALFDLDDTLFAHARAVREGIVAYAALLGDAYAGEAGALQRRWYALEEEHYHRYLAGELDYEGQRRARATAFAADAGVELTPEQASAWFAAYLGHYVAAWTLHDDALPVLDRLDAAGVRIGVITNGDVDFQTTKMDAIALTERVEHLVASGEVGVTKPDAQIFRVACERFGVAPADALYVGDRLGTDAIGAAHAGLRGVWLDRVGGPEHGRELPPEAVEFGVRRIGSLDELDAIAGLTG
ncbi:MULTISPECIES: HAD family hydrolase [unclassified Rathayibacter]|uniref:HAD family hydrolase n=1 Tax=unclassified Rathayibacter TaxID=2609250 RepID=UPI000F4B0CBB|nr:MULTISPECIES: HAD family hydrolase [unclassified Rathayibacter]ROP57503.1 putative hydrolase of the HAD superfamily [Rathayibacter sp. PhB186]ROS55888.1 putative hydrolase of the HAD superfamily [Rathayibacter sp. PhB185]